MTQRRHTRTVLSGAVTAAVLATTAMAGSAASANPDPLVPVPAADPPTATAQTGHDHGTDDGTDHAVTLVTGDVVTLTRHADGADTVTVEPAPGSDGGVRTQVIGEEVHVIPDAALPYLAAGTVDQDLFNVSALVDQGAAGGGTPVIVTFEDGKRPDAAALGAVAPTARLESLNALAAQPAAGQTPALWTALTAGGSDGELAPGIAAVHLDGPVEASLEESVSQIGAPEAWADGVTGEGATVAVLDTGVDLSHPDLAEVVVDTVSFVPGEDITDHHGHGTHVASTVAGSGAASEGTEQGVAPGAELIAGKVLAQDGFGQESWVIDGMEWAAENADVVNMSLGNMEPSDGTDPMSLALQSLSEESGTLFVVAAGNSGRVGGIGSPGAAEAALTVGAVDAMDQRAGFQDMGPRVGDGLVKPDLTAPGVGILAARSQDAAGEGWYTTMNGTSMATPHVAGAAALLLQEHPDWTGTELKQGLMTSALGLQGEGPFQVGAGRVDVPAALSAPVTATGALSFGYFAWPHEGDEPVTRTAEYTNRTDADVTLALAVEGTDQEGAPLPDGLVELGATEVVVPAGTTGQVQLTLDPAVVPLGATVSGYVIASVNGTAVARTGWGAVKEDERYDLTLRATGLDGEPALAYVSLKERASELRPVAVDGEVTLRLPVGTYSAMSFMGAQSAADELGAALVGDPQIELTGDTVVELDARAAEEITVQVPTDGLEPSYRRLEYHLSGGTGMTDMYLVPETADRLYAAPMEGTTDGDFEFLTRWRLRTPLLEVLEDGAKLDVLGHTGGGYPDGERVLPAVYAGTGTPEELAGVDADGAAVVITRDQTLSPYEVAFAAQEAGAGLLVVVNDEPGEFSGWFGGPEGQQLSVPVAGVSGVEGAGLVDRVQAGGVELTMGGGIDSPDVYDLVDPHPGSIPADLAYAPGEEDLARIDSAYHGSSLRQGGEFRYDFRPHSTIGVGSRQLINTPFERTEWVSAQEGTQWYQEMELIDGSWTERGSQEGYQPGQETEQAWLAAVVQPRLGEGYWGPNRQGGFLQVNLPSWAGDEPTHTGSLGSGGGTDDQTIRWFDGDTLLEETVGWQSSSIDVDGTAPQQLRVTNDVSRDAQWRTSLSSSTEWTFWTEGPEEWQNYLPFVQVDFDVATDLTGTALSGTTDTIGLTAWNLPGTTRAGTITQGSLEVSYDSGATWESLALTGAEGDWSAEVDYPDGAESVSLRGAATDSEGNAVTMEVIEAYLLPEEEPEPAVRRIGGSDRYDTAALIAAEYPDGADTVYVVTGQKFADALVGAAPASEGRRPGGVDLFSESGLPAPVLLVKEHRIPDETRAALDAVAPERVVILGGESAVSGEVAEELGDWGSVERIAGANRYETAAMLADLYPVGLDRVYVASGREANFPDALAGAALAGHEGVPVLLTKTDEVPDRVLESLERLDAGEVVVLGGSAAVNEEVFAQLGADRRLAGANRYETAAAISATYPAGTAATYLATGQQWPDALTGSALAASQDVPITLTRAATLPEASEVGLAALAPDRAIVLGGTAAVSEEVLELVRALLQEWAG